MLFPLHTLKARLLTAAKHPKFNLLPPDHLNTRVAPTYNMGNRTSCINATAPGSLAHHRSGYSVIRVVHALDGRTCELEEPMKVGELMLEFPNHFVAEYDHQQLAAHHAQRVSPLPADHDTSADHVYFLLPMHRLNTRLSAEELHHISTPAWKSGASATARAPGHSTKVIPLSAHQYEQAEKGQQTLQSIAKSCSFPAFDVLEEDAPQQQQPQQRLHYMLTSRPWTPQLDTIVESPPLTV